MTAPILRERSPLLSFALPVGQTPPEGRGTPGNPIISPTFYVRVMYQRPPASWLMKERGGGPRGACDVARECD